MQINKLLLWFFPTAKYVILVGDLNVYLIWFLFQGNLRNLIIAHFSKYKFVKQFHLIDSFGF